MIFYLFRPSSFTTFYVDWSVNDNIFCHLCIFSSWDWSPQGKDILLHESAWQLDTYWFCPIRFYQYCTKSQQITQMDWSYWVGKLPTWKVAYKQLTEFKLFNEIYKNWKKKNTPLQHKAVSKLGPYNPTAYSGELTTYKVRALTGISLLHALRHIHTQHHKLKISASLGPALTGL